MTTATSSTPDARPRRLRPANRFIKTENKGADLTCFCVRVYDYCAAVVNTTEHRNIPLCG